MEEKISIDYEKECARFKEEMKKREDEYNRKTQTNSEFYGQAIKQKDEEIAWYKKVIEGILHI